MKSKDGQTPKDYPAKRAFRTEGHPQSFRGEKESCMSSSAPNQHCSKCFKDEEEKNQDKNEKNEEKGSKIRAIKWQ